MSTIKLKDGTTAHAFFFRAKGWYRMTVWAKDRREAQRKADRFWGKGKAVLEVAT